MAVAKIRLILKRALWFSFPWFPSWFSFSFIFQHHGFLFFFDGCCENTRKFEESIMVFFSSELDKESKILRTFRHVFYIFLPQRGPAG